MNNTSNPMPQLMPGPHPASPSLAPIAVALRGNQTFKVLLIEDDFADAIIVERLLENSQPGFAIRHCGCLEDAIGGLNRESFDIALLDLSLPDSFGLSALDKLHTAAPEMPIVVLTGNANDDLALQSLEQGAQDYIVKYDLKRELLTRTLRYAVQRQQIQTENRRLLKQMEVLARHDPLTGVLNRHSFAEHFEHERQRAQRYQKPLSCVVLDIDFFKRINDSYGHAAGDRVLQMVAERLSKNSRRTDFVGRLGGEEFCVLLPEINEADALAWAERARLDVSQLVIPVAEGEVSVTISLGVASRSEGNCDAQSLMNQADEAMFVAKQLGRNQVVGASHLNGIDQNDGSEFWDDLTANELMSPLKISLSPEQKMMEAVQMSLAQRADSIAVLDAQARLVGVLGEEDIMAAVLRSDFSSTVGKLMKTQLVTYAPETPAREVCEFLCRAAIRQVFIVDGQRPLGVIRRADFIRWLHQSTPANSRT